RKLAPDGFPDVPTSPPSFSPPNSAVWVNALWFLSLVMSLTCALLATLLQQWARRYLKITQSRYSPHKRARIRAFFAEGVEKCLLPWAVEALPTLLHLSLFLFFAGLVVFLCNVNLTIFKLVLSWVGLSGPTSSSWLLSVSKPGGKLSQITCAGHAEDSRGNCFEVTTEIDSRAFMWTFDCLDEDHELEHFFSGLPGFRSSNVVKDPLRSLTEEQKRKIYGTLHGLLQRTFSSDLLPATVKNRRSMICAKAVDTRHTPDPFNILHTILSEYQYGGPPATAIANIVRKWGNNVDEKSVMYARAAVCKIIATRQTHDDSWYLLTSDELAVPEAHLRDCAAHGDSLPLLILIHLVRQQIVHFRKPSWRGEGFSLVLNGASKFNAQDTSPELQHKFCGLWNQIVNEVQDGNDRRMSFHVLGQIRNVYLALHQGTDSAPARYSSSTGEYDKILYDPTSYPVCKVPGHHPDTTSRIHDDHAATAFPPAIPHDRDKIPLVPSLPTPYPPPSSTYASLPVDEMPTDAPLVDSNLPLPVQTTSEDPIIPSSLNLATSRGSIDTYQRTMVQSTPEPLVSIPPPKSIYSPDAAVVEPTVSDTTSYGLNVPSSASSSPFLDDILPAGHPSSMLPPATSGPCRPWESGSTADGEDSATASALFRERGKDILQVHDDVTMVTPDSPSQPPQTIVDIAIAGPSRSSLYADYIGEYPQRPCGQPVRGHIV
ncbi:hypothetical protein V8E53_001673, partial [Lactarius tabidus]